MYGMSLARLSGGRRPGQVSTTLASASAARSASVALSSMQCGQLSGGGPWLPRTAALSGCLAACAITASSTCDQEHAAHSSSLTVSRITTGCMQQRKCYVHAMQITPPGHVDIVIHCDIY